MPYDGANFDTKPDLSDLMDDEILRTLVEADHLLSDESKWCKGTQRDPNGAMCIYGAIGYAHHGDIYLSAVNPSFDKELNPLLVGAVPDGALVKYSTRWPVAAWNNDPERTFADVKALFARAIDARAKALRGS